MSAKHNFIPWYRDHWKDFLSTGTYELARACWDAGYDEASTYAQTAEAKLDLIEQRIKVEVSKLLDRFWPMGTDERKDEMVQEFIHAVRKGGKG